MHIGSLHRVGRSKAISVWRQAFLFIAFILFITGLFAFAYGLLAMFLLSFSSKMLVAVLFGLAAAYIGRRWLRIIRR